jgi:hypothetical protein
LEEEEKTLTSSNDGVKDYLSGFKVASIEKKVDHPVAQAENIDSSSEDEKEEEESKADNKVFQRMFAQMKERAQKEAGASDTTVRNNKNSQEGI